MRGPIRYAQNGDVSIAYQVTGDGPFDLVLVPGFTSHLEFDWEEPRHAAFLGRLASFSRLIRLDKRGTGLSDRHGGIADLETRMDDVRAVMDAVGSERAAVFGYFEGGPMSILFAATYPERTRAIALHGTFATAPVHDLDEAQRAALIDDVVRGWGEGDGILRFAPDADDVMKAWWGTRERVGGSPGAVRNLITSMAVTDVRDALPLVQAPTLVLHRTDEPLLGVEKARELASTIPGARLVELPGSSTLPWIDAGPLLDEVEEFFTGARPQPVADRILATILFTDLVDSTERARAMGDSAWSRLVEQHHAAVRRELESVSGAVFDPAGDGFFAVFDGPARAIRCALAIQSLVSGLGLEIRAGLHTGEVERPPGGKPRGIAVNVAARVASLAGGGEVLVTATARDLVAGSGLEFDDRGEHELKGLGEARRVYVALSGATSARVKHPAGSELRPGTSVSGYRVEALIGRGGMGAVYRASDKGLGRNVALKVIAPELAYDERFRARFLRESQIAASLDHPHVVPIYQSGEEGGLLFLAMRHVEGTDLAKLLAAEGALEPRRVLSLLSQIAEALDAAHGKGLVHGDVKPSNVLIAEGVGSEHCYLADFGLTRRAGSASGISVVGEIVGTLEYVAPEQITGDAPDARSDVYSLGCVLYECLTGQVPFPRATDVALLWAHVHEEPTPPSQVRPDLPKELDTVLARALAKEPGRRYRSAGEFLEACSKRDATVSPRVGEAE